MSDASETDDLLYGVPAIAKAFGWGPRQAYHLKQAHGLPTFKIGRIVCAKRSAIRQWISDREKPTS
ncbi:DNA-binding protein [Methylobacterium sp. J-026]|uniref:DNA-binding protein n=1 Tax=Methylobacterium sp. J-026 TaxID=2836624 RepID=UPI001FBA1B6A|nr:DNA-binding protein [Methylobacterium sp. J-026]MCJ2133335.1 DNA-binding protein [Methylobacterium sp. J-026]